MITRLITENVKMKVYPNKDNVFTYEQFKAAAPELATTWKNENSMDENDIIAFYYKPGDYTLYSIIVPKGKDVSRIDLNKWDGDHIDTWKNSIEFME